MKKQGYPYRVNGQLKYRPARYAKPLRDPAITKAADLISRMTAREIADRSWVSPSAARNLLNGKTMRPQNLTIEGLLRAAGWERVIVKRESQ